MRVLNAMLRMKEDKQVNMGKTSLLELNGMNMSYSSVKEAICHKLHSVISPPILQRFPRSQSQLKALKKTFRSMPVTSRGDQ